LRRAKVRCNIHELGFHKRALPALETGPDNVKSLGIFLGLLLFASLGHASPKEQTETIFLFQNRKVTITVPAGLGFQSSKDDRGIISIRLGHPKGQISMQLSFLPDAEGRFANARQRKEFMNATFQEYVAGSVEKAMQFEELDPKVGAGTFCVFTDANLVGKTKLPPGEFIQSTTGLKAWPGVVAVFTLLSNDITSPEYAAVMAMLRNSVEERAPPLL
jgi:hypothetical protein